MAKIKNPSKIWHARLILINTMFLRKYKQCFKVLSKKFFFAIMSNVMTHTRMSQAVPLQVVTLEKPHVTHGTSVRLHP